MLRKRGPKILYTLYVYDCLSFVCSTHGTFLNKTQVEANTYIRLKTGHMFKFGGSSRHFIMQVCLKSNDCHMGVMALILKINAPPNFPLFQGGTPDDEEAESELSLTQLKQMGKMREEQLKNKIAEEEERERRAKEREAKGGWSRRIGYEKN